jgi:tRNA(Arg) A34 adenosine deaminase TadA
MTARTNSDLTWLRRSFELATENVDTGDQAFGAVLIDAAGGMMIEATNRRERSGDCTAHAETDVARAASQRWSREELAGFTLFSSCEPCPMCAGAIAWSGIGRLVYGLSQAAMYEIYAGTTRRWAKPPACRSILSGLEPPMEVVGPVIEEEAAEPHRHWLALNA